MAGDLLLAFCRAPRRPDGTAAPEDAARAVLARRIDALRPDVVEQVAWNRYGGMAEADVCADCGRVVRAGAIGLEHAGDDGVEPDHEAIFGEGELPGELETRRTLHAAVDALFRENRVCHTVSLDGCAWVVSGGISGGDSPTDEYDDLRSLAVAGVTDEPIPVARAADTAS